MSCGVGGRCNSDPVLLWLWHRPAAVTLIQPLAWELPYASGVTLKKKKKKIDYKAAVIKTVFRSSHCGSLVKKSD